MGVINSSGANATSPVPPETTRPHSGAKMAGMISIGLDPSSRDDDDNAQPLTFVVLGGFLCEHIISRIPKEAL